jgi:[glutamine synthetase] adenylyltransferase / [glutamine synthetase]-adenylyl-L-tyrosine phosphorylase
VRQRDRARTRLETGRAEVGAGLSVETSLAAISSRVSPELAHLLPGLLKESPDAGGAAVMLERLISAAPADVVQLLNRHPVLAHYAILIFGHSRYLGETLARNADLFEPFLRHQTLDRSYSREEFQAKLKLFRAQAAESDIATLLASFKRREYVRILLRDLLRIATLAETTAEISALSDALIAEALQVAEKSLREKYGLPAGNGSTAAANGTQFAVLSLGKLGGNELNYNSDVDLMYLFGEHEELGGGFAAQEYFVRLAQGVTDLLSRATGEGPVFRIDLRLRPRGRDGELTIGIEQALLYYTQSAEDWERQALIKVRHSAGEARLTRAFVRGVQAQVYRQQINFSAIKTALVAREKMDTRRRRVNVEHGPSRIDVKLDHGGIRDIEFLVQCLQRVYGGREPWLRSRGTLFALQKLYDKGHIRDTEFQQLSSAYEFLRHVEHRLQLRQGQQTHLLPATEEELRILQKSMQGYLNQFSPGKELVPAVRWRMEAVSEIYKRVILQQQAREQVEVPDFTLLGEAEVAAPEASDQQILARLASDAPRLYTIASRRDLDPVANKNLFRFLSGALTSSERYAATIQQPEAVEKALAIFAASEYLTEILVRYPEEIATLGQLETVPSRCGSGYLFESMLGDRQTSGDAVFAYVAASAESYEEKLALLRRHYRHRTFAEGARDIADAREVYSTLGATTAVAEDAIACALGVAECPPGLAVLAFGRLGTREFDICSDADLLFVCEEALNPAKFSRGVERMVQGLSAYTQDGRVFSVDTRLRPRGGEGELVVTVPQLESYFAREAQPWEALLYTKLRFVAGDLQLGGRAISAAQVLFGRYGSGS